LTSLLSLMSSVLPGARNVRAPFFAGLLWAGFLWLLLGERIPSRSEAAGATEQVYGLIDFLGALGTVALGSLLIFVLGALATVGVNAASSLIGRLQARAVRGIAWQRNASRRRAELRLRLPDLEQTIALAAKTDPRLDARQKNSLQEEAETAQKNRAEAEDRIRVLEPAGRMRSLRRLWIPNNAVTRLALGYIPDENDEHTTAQRIVSQWYHIAASKIAPEPGAPSWPENGWHAGLDAELLAEFKPDPVEALKAIDYDLFLEKDRARSEREIRVAVAAPAIAFCAYGLAEWSGWFAPPLLLAIALFLSNSLAPAAERARVMTLVALRGKETPAMRHVAAPTHREILMSLRPD
jgi:hypothetical protein